MQNCAAVTDPTERVHKESHTSIEDAIGTQFFSIKVQCPLDIETLDKAAALDLATATPLTDLRQYINSNLGFRDLEI